MSTTPAANDRVTTWLGPDQVGQLRTACYDDRFHPPLRQRNDALVTLLYDTGLRVGELVRLDVDSVDLDAGEVRVPDDESHESRSTETASERTLALDPAHSLGTLRLFKSYLYDRHVESSVLFPSQKGGRLTPKAVRDLITTAAETAAIRPYTPTDRGAPGEVSPQILRHSTAWRLLNVEQRSITDVSERLGHTARSTTRSLYGHFASDPASPSPNLTEHPLDDLDRSTLVEGVLSAIPDVLYVFDTDGRMRWWNDRLAAVTGYTDAEIATMHPLEFIPDEDTAQLAEAISRVVRGETIETRESYLMTKDGTYILTEFNGAALNDDDGTVVGLAGSGRDITDRKARERDLERYRKTVNAVGDAVYQLDTEGRFVAVNDVVTEVTGYEREELIGEYPSIILSDEEIAESVELIRDLLRDGGRDVGVLEVEVRTADGETIPAEIRMSLLTDDGELQGTVGVVRDISDRKAREREIERQRDELERVNQVNAVIRGIDQALVRATGRAEIEQAVCDRLATADPYVGAWIGTQRTSDETLTPRSWAGLDEADVDAIVDTINDTESESWPSRRSLRTHEIHVTAALLDEPAAAACREVLATNGCTVSIAVPIRYRETLYGVLVVYAEDPATVGERQRTVLAELGETVGHAIAASERKEALTADSVVELSLEINDPDQFFVQVASQPGMSATLEGIAGLRRDSTLEYFTVTGASPTTIGDLADRTEYVDKVRVMSHDDDTCLCEVRVTGPSIVTTVAEYGGTITEMTAETGRGSVTVELSRSADIGRVLDALRATVTDIDLQAKQTVDRPIQTDYRFRSTVDDRLTDKQHGALEAAYFAGFFEQPRLSTGEDIAESLDLSPSTFHQHIRVGLRKLLATLVETSLEERA